MAKRHGRPGSTQTNVPTDALGAMVAARNDLQKAETMRQAGKLRDARRICEAILKRYPDYVGALHTLGLVLADMKDHRRALNQLLQATMLNPEDHTVLTALSGVYLRLGHGAAALRALEQAKELKPDDANILATFGEICREQQEFDAGAQAFEEALSHAPDLHAARFGFGNCLSHMGDASAAADAFETLIADGRINANTVYALAQLPPGVIRSDLFALCGKLERKAAADAVEERSLIALTRAAALHHADRHEEAFAQLVAGNRPLATSMATANATHRKVEERFLEATGKVQMQSVSAGGSGPISLFIMGPSRAGKTTLERLLASHGAVARGYENPIVENSVRRAFQTAAMPTRERIFELPPSLDGLFREIYMEEFARRAGQAQILTNTQPAHIFGALRLSAVLPGARFVFIRRPHLDTALRIFMRRYLTGNAYAYDLAHIFEHLEWSDRMIDAVAAKIPERSAVIDYPSMVADPAATRATIEALCGQDPGDEPAPGLSDDSGCGEPYRPMIEEALGRSV